MLTFRNVAVQYGFALAPARYTAVWHRFDNETGQTERIGETEGPGEKIAAPAGALVRTTPESTRPGGGAFLRVDISAPGAQQASWASPVYAWFRHTADGWSLVGFDRMPGAPPMRPGLVGAEPIDKDTQERKAGTQ
jgi:hypothetical protein